MLRLQVVLQWCRCEGRNGVGIVLSKERKDCLVSVSITNDRVMSVKLCIGETGRICSPIWL